MAGGPSGGGGKPAWEYVLRAGDGDFGLFWTANDPKRPGLRTLVTEKLALGFLRGTKVPKATAVELRRMLRATWMRAVGAARPESKQRLFAIVFGGGEMTEKDEGDLLVLVAQIMAADKLRAERIVVPTGGTGRRPAPPPPEKVAPVMSSAPRTKLTWITIKLVDEDKHPIPSQRYELKLPDKSVRKGAVDDPEAEATERGIDPGTCTVKFPEAGDDAWVFLDVTAE